MPAMLHWSVDNWRTIHDTRTRDTHIGVSVADLPTETLAVGVSIVFTFYWPDADRWEQKDFSVVVGDACPG